MQIKKSHSFFQSFTYALEGLLYIVKSQKHMKIHISAGCIAIGISWYLGISKTEWLWILMSIVLVMVTETMNTAIETAVDLTTTEIHPLAKHAKDCAAGAVLLASLFSLMIGSIIFIPKVKGLL
jgi:diacylglycerol kinase